LTPVHIRGCACIAESDLMKYIERNTQRARS
jgi:hypothetical protein